MKKLFFGLVIGILISLSITAFAGLTGPSRGGGPATPNALCKVDDDTWILCNASDTFGDSSNPIGDIDVDNLVVNTLFTLGGTVGAGGMDMNGEIIENIGAAGTDFSATGGLTLADALVVTSGDITLTGAQTLGTSTGQLDIQTGAGDGDIVLTPHGTGDIILDGHWNFNANALTSLTDNNTTLTAYATKAIAIEGVSFDGGLVTNATSVAGAASTASLTLAGETTNAQRDVVVSTVNAAGDTQLTRLTFGSDADIATLTFTALTTDFDSESVINVGDGGNDFGATNTLVATTITGNLTANDAAGPAFIDEAATTTNPTLCPDKAELDTGIGWASDTLHFVLGGTSEYNMSATALNLGTNNLTMTGTLGSGNLIMSSAQPTLNFDDTDASDHTDNATIYANATDAGSGTEDVDVVMSQYVGGALTVFLNADADGSLTLGQASQAVAFNTSAVSGITTLGLTQGITQAPTVTGNLFDLQLENEWTTGIIAIGNFGSNTTLSGDVSGVYLDFESNVTSVNKDINGFYFKTPAQTNTSDDANVSNGFRVSGGAVDQGAGVGSTTWKGLDVTMPDITQTAGTVNSYGVYVDGGTVTSGTEYGLYVNSANSYLDGTVTVGGALALGANNLTSTGTITGTQLDLGVATSTLGVLTLSGNTSGTVTINTLAAAGTYTLTTPPDDGDANEFLQTNGSGVLDWAAAGGGATIISIQPKPVDNIVYETTKTYAGNPDLLAHFFSFVLPEDITVNKFTFRVNAYTEGGTIDIAIYSEDGQTKHTEITTADITGTGLITTSISSVALTSGIYYVGIVPNESDMDLVVNTYNTGFSLSIANEPVHSGTKVVSSGTLPATINTVSDITSVDDEPWMFRLDN